MSILDRIFSWGRGVEEENIAIRFGRYSDAYKSKRQYEYWDQAKELFEDKNYLRAYEHFFNYLRDERENSVDYTVHSNHIDFTIIQGSKQIQGVATNEKVVAETNVVKCKQLKVGFMRRLVESNYNLRYCRFALKDNIICLKFDTAVVDGSPEKLYFALKEMAIKADKEDDLLVNQFKALEAINNRHIQALPDTEKQIKYKYLHLWIDDTLATIDTLQPNKFSTAISYLLLNLAYKIDYLLASEGQLMDAIERIHRIYFTADESSVMDKNNRMLKEFRKILIMPKAEVYQELYRIKATFGVSSPTSPLQVGNVIGDELNNMIWYRDNNYPHVAITILEYIIQYCLFYYGMPEPTKKLLHLMGVMINADYFKALGYKQTYYDPATGTLHKTTIKRKIRAIEEEAQKAYPHFKVNVNLLKYGSLLDFVHSLLLEMKGLRYDVK